MSWMQGKGSRRLSSGWVTVPIVQTPVLPKESPSLCRIKTRLPHENRCCDITQYYLLATNIYTPTGTIFFFFSCFTSNGRILILPLGFFIVLVNIYVLIHVLMCVIRHPDIISAPIQCLLSFSFQVCFRFLNNVIQRPFIGVSWRYQIIWLNIQKNHLMIRQQVFFFFFFPQAPSQRWFFFFPWQQGML